LKDRNGEPERGSEWEQIKILFKNSAYEPDFTRAPPQAFLDKTQPTATAHTQRKLTQNGCWQPKPVRPVSKTGQTASVGLSLTQAEETGQTG
jgi:hypothetical protein